MAGSSKKSKTKAGGSKPKAKGKAKAKKPAKRGSWLTRSIWFMTRWSLVAAVWVGIAAGGAMLYFAHDLPDIRDQMVLERRPSITILASDGSEIGRYGDLHTSTVTVDELPDHLIEAVLAIEDRRFYWHPGIDPIGLTRAAVTNYRAGRVVQGGSTLTQQLAKNLFLQPERSIKRKAQEALLALWLELSYTKDEILGAYLNRVYLGAGTYGVDAAARTYFGKSARALSLRESALIAGLLKAPSRYAPTNNAKRGWQRARTVLAAMEDAGYINANQRSRAASGRPPIRAVAGSGLRYFADWVMEQSGGYTGRTSTDLIVSTTLDGGIQRAAERAIADSMANGGRKRGARQAAALIMAPDGAVKAMIGGVDYSQSQFNRVTQGQRQPGSAFKPILFLAALERGRQPFSTISDDELTIGGWSPRNYGGRFHGTVTLAEALAGSYNVAAVRLLDQIGTSRLRDMSRRLGITAPLGNDLSLALGTAEVSMLELTAAYATIANGGRSIWPYAITQIREKGGRVIYRHKPAQGAPVVNRGATQALSGMLQKVVTEGTGKKAALDRPVAGKTGTTQGFRDAWFVGYTADYVGAVWFGNDNNRAMDRIEDEEITGGSLPAETWASIMASAHRGKPARALPEIGAIPTIVSTAPVAQAPDIERSTDSGARGNRDIGALGRFIEGLGSEPGTSAEGEPATAPSGPRWD